MLPTKQSLRQRLSPLVPRRLRSTSPSSQAPTLPSAVSSTPAPRLTLSPTSQSTALQPATSVSQQPNAPAPPQHPLLRRTLDRLLKVSKEDHVTIQAEIPPTAHDADSVLGQTLAQAETLQQEYLGKGWEFTFHNHTYIIKEKADTVVRWLNQITSIGGIVANVDPVHVGLPWAGIRLLLMVATNNANQMASLLSGCETALYMSNRLKAYTDFLARLPPTQSRSNFEDSLIEFYVYLLRFLARAIRLYRMPSARRAVQSLWKDEEISRFETECGQLGLRVEAEASNCDRYLSEQHLQQTIKTIHRLRAMQESLDRIETKIDYITTAVSPTQVDDVIRQAYNNGRLRVERLSGESLSLEHCFVNLSITRHVHDSDDLNRHTAVGQVSRFSLAARLKVETPPDSDQMSLRTLFEPRKQKDGLSVRPTRVLIWGRAGMGKTTLCKKIVDEVSNHGLWKDLYDRVIWLPLRRLRKVEVQDTVELIQHEFSLTRLGDRLSETLGKLIQDERTLFLLDGLDEVSLILDRDSPCGRVLHDLVSRSHIIITSRPHSTRMLDHKAPDLELETVGFFPQQVEEYIQRVAVETQMTDRTAGEIRSFIQSRPLVQSLARIPIQLDAICYTWRVGDFSQNIVTMTSLYLRIAQSLWKDTLLRLGKKRDGELIVKQQLEYWLDFEDPIRQEINFLQELAFRGLCEETTEFGTKDIARVEAGRQIPSDRLIHVSFLRASDSSVEVNSRTLHFIHLTFQEFFAAQFFVRHWMSGRALPLGDTAGDMLNVTPNQLTESITPENFVLSEKYMDRYDIFWRFVAGLLQAEPDDVHLYRFLNTLENKPVDLVGQAHQRLMIHCLSEISPNNDQPAPRIQELEEKCLQWILCVSKLNQERQKRNNSRSLVWEAECSDYLLERLLAEPETIHEVLQALCRRSSISSRLLDATFKLLDEDCDRAIRTLAIRLIGLFCGRDQNKKFTEFWDSARSISVDILDIIAAWQQTQRLLEPAVQVLMSLLQHSEASVRRGAADALGRQATLPTTAVEALVSLLQDSEASVRREAADALGGQATLPTTAVEALVSLLQDSEASVREGAADALRGQATLPTTAVEALVSLLQDSEASVRRGAADALGERATLPTTAVEALVSLLQHSEDSVSSLVISIIVDREEILCILPTFQSTTLQQFIKWWLQMEPVICFIWQHHVYIRSSRVSLTKSLQEHELKSFESQWLRAWNELGLPSLSPSLSAYSP